MRIFGLVELSRFPFNSFCTDSGLSDYINFWNAFDEQTYAPEPESDSHLISPSVGQNLQYSNGVFLHLLLFANSSNMTSLKCLLREYLTGWHLLTVMLFLLKQHRNSHLRQTFLQVSSLLLFFQKVPTPVVESWRVISLFLKGEAYSHMSPCPEISILKASTKNLETALTSSSKYNVQLSCHLVTPSKRSLWSS